MPAGHQPNPISERDGAGLGCSRSPGRPGRLAGLTRAAGGFWSRGTSCMPGGALAVAEPT